MYQVNGQEVVTAWLQSEPNPQHRSALLDVMASLGQEPVPEDAVRLEDERAEVYVLIANLGDKMVLVRYFVGHQLHAVRILAIESVP